MARFPNNAAVSSFSSTSILTQCTHDDEEEEEEEDQGYQGYQLACLVKRDYFFEIRFFIFYVSDSFIFQTSRLGELLV